MQNQNKQSFLNETFKSRYAHHIHCYRRTGLAQLPGYTKSNRLVEETMITILLSREQDIQSIKVYFRATELHIFCPTGFLKNYLNSTTLIVYNAQGQPITWISVNSNR